MRRGGGVDRAATWRHLALAAALGVAVVFAPGDSAEAVSLVSGNYQFDWSEDVDRTATGRTDIRTIKHTLEVKYKGFVSPVVRNEVTFKVEQEIKSDAADITRFLPVADIGFKGRFWDAKLGGKRTHENSDDPATAPKITDSYVAEFFYTAPRNVPDLKLKYTIDTDSQTEVTDIRKDGLTVSTAYNLSNWLDIKGDYTWTKNDNRLQPDSDTIEQKKHLVVGVRRTFFEKFKIDIQYTLDETRNRTIRDAGGLKDKKEDQTHTLKNALSFRPFGETNIDGSYDVDVKQNIVSGEHTLTATAKTTLTQKIGKPVETRLEFQRVTTEVRHSADDYRAPEDTWTAEITGRFTRYLDLTLRYQNKLKDEVHNDPTKSKKDGSVNTQGTWTGELTRFCRAYVTYDSTDTYSFDVKTQVNTKYSFRVSFDFKPARLLLEPTYDLTTAEDLVKGEDTKTRDFKFKITYVVLSTRSIEAKIDHTYGRKTDSLANTIQRTDNSLGNVVWKNVLPGWMLAFDLTRSATDTSGDDLPPDIVTSFAFKADYTYEWLTLNGAYKYDKKSLADDAATLDLKAGWVAPHWEASLVFQGTKTYSLALQEGYTITVMFKYIL